MSGNQKMVAQTRLESPQSRQGAKAHTVTYAETLGYKLTTYRVLILPLNMYSSQAVSLDFFVHLSIMYT